MDNLKSIAISFAEELIAELEARLERAKAHLEELKGVPTTNAAGDPPPGSTNPPPPHG